MKLRTVALAAFLISMPVWPADPVEPIAQSIRKADPAPATPTIEDLMARIKARRAQVADLLKADAADVALLNAKLKELADAAGQLGGDGKAPVIESAAIGKPGKDGHSPVLKWGTGADADRISIDGVFSGPHLTGPQGPPGGPPPVVDPFTKEVTDAAADATTDKASIPTVITVWQSLLPYVDTDPDTGQLYSRYKAGFEAAKLAGKLPLLMDAVNRPLYELMSSTAQPLTPALQLVVKAQIMRTVEVLKGIK